MERFLSITGGGGSLAGNAIPLELATRPAAYSVRNEIASLTAPLLDRHAAALRLGAEVGAGHGAAGRATASRSATRAGCLRDALSVAARADHGYEAIRISRNRY